MPRLRLLERWRKLSPEEKEAVFIGIHGGILGLIALSARRAGKRLVFMALGNPGLVAAGLLVGGAYFWLLKKLVIERSAE